MRTLRPLLGLIGLLTAATFAPLAAARAEDETFKDWWVACDNVRVCTAFGLPPQEGTGVALRIRREAKGAAMPVIDVVMDSEQSKGVTGPLSLLVDGEEITPTGAPAKVHDDFRVWTVPDDMAAELAAALTRGSNLSVRAGNRAVAAISLSGATAAQRWMDDRQKRANNVSALVARGPAPESAVPAPPPLPVVKRAAPVAQAGLPAKPPASVRQLTAKMECDAAPSFEPSVSRLGSGVLLWVMPCWTGAYNVTSALVLADEKGGAARLADLGGTGDATERAMAMNLDYDAKTQTLESFGKGRGVGDCGVSQSWGWTGSAFVRVGQLEMSPCRALSGDFWVETYRSR